MKDRLARAGVLWTVTLLLSRGIGVVRESVIGATLGVSSGADVYAAAFRVPDMFAYIVSGGALSIIFIPMFTAHAQRGDEARAWRAFSVVANFIVLLLAIFTPLAWLAMPRIAPHLAPGFSPTDLALLVKLSRIVLPAQVFHLLGGLLSASLLARDKHTVPALAPLVYTLGIIAGGLIFRSAEGFAWGVLGGAFAGPFLLPLVAALRSGLRWQPVFSFRDPDFRTYLWQALPVMLGFSIVSVDDVAWTYFASDLGAGHVSILNYAKTLMKVPMGVFGMAMGYAAYPTLARLCAEGKPGEAYQTLVVAGRRALVLAFASQVALTVAGPEIATIVLGTRRIPVERMGELGVAVGVFSLALGAWTAQTLLARGFYARGKAWLPTWLGFGVLVVSLPLYGVLGRAFGINGLALASSVGITIYTVLLSVQLRREIGEGPGFGGFLLRALPATVLAIGLGFLVRGWLPPLDGTRLQAAWRLGALALVGGPAWLAAAWAFRVPEMDSLLGAVRRRLPAGR